jgi:hypothetical protein
MENVSRDKHNRHVVTNMQNPPLELRFCGTHGNAHHRKTILDYTQNWDNAKVTECQAYSRTCHVSRNKELFTDQQYFGLLYRSVAVTRNKRISDSFTSGYGENPSCKAQLKTNQNNAMPQGGAVQL